MGVVGGVVDVGDVAGGHGEVEVEVEERSELGDGADLEVLGLLTDADAVGDVGPDTLDRLGPQLEEASSTTTVDRKGTVGEDLDKVAIGELRTEGVLGSGGAEIDLVVDSMAVTVGVVGV